MAERDDDRQRRRAQALRSFATPYAKAQNALYQVYGDGGAARTRFPVRRSLILRRRPAEASHGPTQRSAPVAELITARGWALHLYLIALFEAQSRRRAGSSIQNTRKLQEPDRPGWVNLLPSVTTTADPVAGALRQTKRALILLSQANLVRFARPAGTAHRFEHFQLLLESGESYGLWRQDFYFVPKRDQFGSADTYLRPPAAAAGQAEVLTLPSAFFLQGWVHVLSPAEIITYLMLRDLETRYPDAAKDGVYVTDPQRQAWYGISRDVYESHQQLAAYGLIERLADPNRRGDGKIRRRPGGGQHLQPLRFRTVPEGLNQAGLATVAAALTHS